MKNQYIKYAILKNAMPLEKFGVNELAWEKDAAKKLIALLIDSDIGILGGDVYKLRQSTLEPLCDNWACEPQNDETREEYFLRSKKKALDYIEHYPSNIVNTSIIHDEKIIFVLVFTEYFDQDIKERASSLDENWLLCPICMDGWECTSRDSIVICPKCNEILYNPRHQT